MFEFFVALAILLIVGGVVAIRRSRTIPSSYQTDYEAVYADSALPSYNPSHVLAYALVKEHALVKELTDRYEEISSSPYDYEKDGE